MKFKPYYIVVPMAFLLMACGSSNSETGATATGSVAGGPVTATPVPGATATPAPTPVANEGVCPNATNPSGATLPLYRYTSTQLGKGVGLGIPNQAGGGTPITTPFGAIQADSSIRVRVTSGPAGVIVGQTSLTHSYTQMGYTVEVVDAGGNIVASKVIEGTPIEKNGITYSQGLPVGSRTRILDFGPLGPYGPYSVRITNAKTDYRCRTWTWNSSAYYCNNRDAWGFEFTSSYSASCVTNYCSTTYNWCTYGATGTLVNDFNSGQKVCCIYGTADAFKSFQQNYCGVGSPMAGDANASPAYKGASTWTINQIEVETDKTQCLQ